MDLSVQLDSTPGTLGVLNSSPSVRLPPGSTKLSEVGQSRGNDARVHETVESSVTRSPRVEGFPLRGIDELAGSLKNLGAADALK